MTAIPALTPKTPRQPDWELIWLLVVTAGFVGVVAFVLGISLGAL